MVEILLSLTETHTLSPTHTTTSHHFITFHFPHQEVQKLIKGAIKVDVNTGWSDDLWSAYLPVNSSCRAQNK